jgi:hypothetical protein
MFIPFLLSLSARDVAVLDDFNLTDVLNDLQDKSAAL